MTPEPAPIQLGTLPRLWRGLRVWLTRVIAVKVDGKREVRGTVLVRGVNHAYRPLVFRHLWVKRTGILAAHIDGKIEHTGGTNGR